MPFHSPSEPSELLRLARGNGGPALGQLLEQYRSYLSLLARLQIGRRLKGKVDPSDVVQDAFLEAHRNFPMFVGTTEAEWANWLRQILADRLAKLLRRYFGTQQRDVRLERDLANELAQSSQRLDRGLLGKQSSPSQEVERREQTLVLASVMEQLPDDYRDVLILRHLEGLSFAEVAQRMDRSLDSVKNLWIRGLAQLRKAMENP